MTVVVPLLPPVTETLPLPSTQTLPLDTLPFEAETLNCPAPCVEMDTVKLEFGDMVDLFAFN